MTTLISATSLSLDFGHGPLFHDLSFTLKLGDRIGLIGHNGCGKSSLLKLLADPENESIQRARACRLQHVEQQLPPEIHALTARRALLETASRLESPPEWQAENLLRELGFDRDAINTPVSALSGGYHTRLLLGRALMQEPNLLLLDEPSNHLDLPSILWLEDFLTRWRGSFLLVSHDPCLLDRVSNKTWFLRDHALYSFDLPCSHAVQALHEADETARARRSAEQKEIDRLDFSRQRVAAWGRAHDNEKLIRKAKSMQKRIDHLKEEQTTVSRGSPWVLQLHGQHLAAKQLVVFEAMKIKPAPEAEVLFEIDDLCLKTGDKVALLGANGSGKSSFLRQCWQSLQTDQDTPGLRYHPGAKLGYYDQSLRQLADGASLSDALYPFAPISEQARKQALIAAGFPFQRHSESVAALSGGERSRLLFLALSLARYHFLWLDEPSNHLDMAGKQQLAEALNAFCGGFILVSHDRQLIEACCRRFWVIQHGRLTEWLDAPSAYQSLFSTPAACEAANSERKDQARPPASTRQDEEALLERLCQLEAWLAADRARKPRHQKPAQQQAWQQEIRQISRQLGITADAV
ncbi:MAG: ABC-F family ATP-binding cassette domain-containing protein [Uliginosibacterium sp.]|nr:ABC-F family ATP-binding cassette domain-containing protein [Uliginosibacterium sp.]